MHFGSSVIVSVDYAVEFSDVYRSYKKDRPVLVGVSFSIHSSRVTGILGPNGSGKSTAIKLIAGIAPPERGAVRSSVTIHTFHPAQ